MVQPVPKRRHGGSPGPRVEDRLTDDWPLYVALLPAALASAAIGLTAVIALGTASSWPRPMTPGAAGVKATPATDNYVEGLAKLGIAKIPHYDPSTVVHSGSRGGPLPLTQLARGCVLLG
jgi:hypothetical protein